MEYIVIRGKKVVKIPEEELQFLQLKGGSIDRKHKDDDRFVQSWGNRLDRAMAKKYSMPIEDVELNWLRRFKDVYHKIKHKDHIEYGERIKVLDIKYKDFFEKQDDILKELCEKSGIKYFPEYRNPQV